MALAVTIAAVSAAPAPAVEQRHPAHTGRVAAPVPLPPIRPAPPSAGANDGLAESWSPDRIMAARRLCIARLAALRAEVEPLAPIRAGACGAPAPVRLARLGDDPAVAIDPPATLDCAMVAALDEWLARIVQPAARRLFGAPVTQLRNTSSYVCRKRYGAEAGKLSEHAVANALDVGGFVLADGRRIEPLRHWGRSERRRATAQGAPADALAQAPGNGGVADRKAGAAPEPVQLPPRREPAGQATPAAIPVPETAAETATQTAADMPERTFLRLVHRRACGLFTTVLGPEANIAHADHFHLDLAARRHGALCE